jgi:predicted nuclease of predicted toxin-antitoxin system
MKFHLDADQSQSVAVVARTVHGIDVTSSHSLGLDHLIDEEQLLYAAQQGRCIVTRNGPDFIALTRRFIEEELPPAGVLIVPESIETHEFARIARALAWFHVFYPDGVPPYFVGYLEDPPDR